MERRKSPRLELNQPVEVSVLGEQTVTMPGMLVNVSPEGSRLIVGRSIPAGAAVRVTLHDAILLGEVCYCQSDRSGRAPTFAIGLENQQVLTKLSDLTKLVERLMGEQRTAEPAPVPKSS